MTLFKRAGKEPTNFPRRISRKWAAVRTWEEENPARKRFVYFCCYSAAFVIVALITLFVYPSNGRSMIWNIDGLEQFYPYFIYEGQWLREIFSGLLSGHGLNIPLWSYELGYGMDIPSTLDTFFDPLNLLSGLCPERYSEYLFQLLVVFRLYLAGLAFSLFALRFGIGRLPVLTGALLYALCGTSLAVAYWPASAWPLVLFPLLLLGVEKALARERPYLFVASVAAFFIISYYFSYMACLLLIPYCAVRVVQTQRSMGVARFALWTLKFLGLFGIGVLIACFSLIPSLIGLFGLERFTDNAVQVPLLYPLQYYTSLVSGFVGTTSVGSDCFIGFGGLAFLACVLLFSRRKENTSLKVTFVLASIMLLLPAFGRLFNGMNYATNRWVWAYALVVCFVVARMLPSLLAAGRRTVKVLVVASIAYGALVFSVAPMRSEATLAAGIVLLATLFAIAQSGLSARARKTSLLCCLTASLAVNAFYFVSPDEGGVGKDSPPLGYAYARLSSDSPNHLVADLGDLGLWRYDGSPAAIERTRNDSLILGLKGIDFYNSSYNSAVDDYHTELAVNKTNINFSYKDLGARSILESLAGVKYYLGSDQNAPAVYLYDDPQKTVATGEVRGIPYQVHEGSNVLPLAYVYDSYIPRDEYRALSPAEKQEALLQGVVLEESPLPETRRQEESRIVASSMTPGSGLTVEDGTIRVSSAGAKITLTFDGLPDSETYVYVDGLGYRALSPMEKTTSTGEFDRLAWWRKALVYKKELEWRAPTYYNVSLASDKAADARQIENFSDTSHMYGGKDEWLVNMGYSKEGKTSVTLTFGLEGEYRYSDLAIVCQPMGNASSRIDALKADPVDNLAFDTNRITASVDLDAPKALYFSVPYSKGWTAFVDGRAVDLKRANTAFMALELDAGAHEVELRYMTPGLLEGFALSGVGLAALAALACSYRLRRAWGRGACARAGNVDIDEKGVGA